MHHRTEMLARLSARAYTQGMTPVTLRVRQLREALGLTQGELAERAGVRRATVNRIENAVPASIDLRVLDQLATALGVEPGFLLVRTPGGRQRS